MRGSAVCLSPILRMPLRIEEKNVVLSYDIKYKLREILFGKISASSGRKSAQFFSLFLTENLPLLREVYPVLF